MILGVFLYKALSISTLHLFAWWGWERKNLFVIVHQRLPVLLLFFFFNLVSEPGFPGTSSSNYLPVYDDLSVNSDFAFGFNTNSVANFLGVWLSL